MKREETQFRTLVELPKWVVQLQPSDNCVFLGSCFAQQMGERFMDYDLNAICNPLGTLYNPESIRLQILQAIHQGEVEPPVFQSGDEWFSWWAGTKVSGQSMEECASVVSGSLAMLGYMLRSAQYLFITLGSNVCYRLKKTGEVVVNCHKVANSSFAEESLTLPECVSCLSDILDEVHAVNPSCKVVFTVSPYRYSKYTFHGSQLSKATLQLAVEEVRKNNPGSVFYFPAYEIVLDELRDYRFYAADMIHPSKEAADYIWSCLQDSIMSPAMLSYLTEYEEVRKGLLHKPKNPDSDAHKAFLSRLESKRLQIRKKYLME